MMASEDSAGEELSRSPPERRVNRSVDHYIPKTIKRDIKGIIRIQPYRDIPREQYLGGLACIVTIVLARRDLRGSRKH